MQSGIDNKLVEQPKLDKQSWVAFDKLSDSKAETKPSADKLVLHEDLYNTLGIVALASPYNELTQAGAEKFVSIDTFTLGDVVCKFGNIEILEQYVDTKSLKYKKAIQLVDALQKKADKVAPGVVISAKSESKNTSVVVSLTKPSPTVYSPIMLQKGLSVEGIQDNTSLRIFPSLSQENQPYKDNLFKKIIFSFSLFGAGEVGKKFGVASEPENVSLMTEAADLSIGEVIVDIFPYAPSVHEEAQFKSLESLLVLMKQIGAMNLQVLCNLHFIQYILHGLSLYLNDKITKAALDKFFQHLILRKEDVEIRLMDLFSTFNIPIFFISSLTNLFDIEQAPGKEYTDYLLGKLNLSAVAPMHGGDNNQFLLNACRSRLGGCDLLLLCIDHNVKLSSIHVDWMNNAKSTKTPLLIKRMKRPAGITDVAETEQKTHVPQNEFFIYGESYGIWHTVSIGSAGHKYLQDLPYDDEILMRSNPLFSEDLIRILRLGHPDIVLASPKDLSVWVDFDKAVVLSQITLNDFLLMADVAAIMIAAKGTLANEVCSIEYASRRNMHLALCYYTHLFETFYQKMSYVDYNILAQQPQNKKYPQRSAVNYSKMIPSTHVPLAVNYSSGIFLLSVLDRWIGCNLSQDIDKQKPGGTLFDFKDTPTSDALSLAQHSTFFKNASRNGAYREGDLQHRPLRGMKNSG